VIAFNTLKIVNVIDFSIMVREYKNVT